MHAVMAQGVTVFPAVSPNGVPRLGLMILLHLDMRKKAAPGQAPKQ